MTLRVRSLAVRGFRAFGAIEQVLNLPSDLAAIWGPNSKGKTSLAEAFEFLLTGRIARRELMASSQDEFADALRNAHLAAEVDVYVAARLTAADGTERQIKRTLTADYGKRQDCASRLEIDGAAATEADLTALGITLSQPPLSAPVLAQHTLAYIFSVRPQDRATYFKTLLEVTDLDAVRNDIAALVSEVGPPDDPLLTKFDTCTAVPALRPSLDPIARAIPKLEGFTARVADAAEALITSAGETAPAPLEERLDLIGRILTDRRSKTFPIRGFERRVLAGWAPPPDQRFTILDTCVEERAKVDEETRQLVALFDQALKIPGIAQLAEPADCPLCGSKSAMTPERVELIRKHVEDARGLQAAEAAARTALAQLSASAVSLADSVAMAFPHFMKAMAGRRREAGFVIARMRSILGDQATLVDPWLDQLRPLARAGHLLARAARACAALAEEQAIAPGALDPATLRAAFAQLGEFRTRLTTAIQIYDTSERPLTTALNVVLDATADTAGWQDFIDVAKVPAAVRTALIDRAARASVEKELNAAIKQIDAAKELVLDEKFSEHSGLVEKWWNRLRPEEPTFFSAVQPRKGARRTIDFKAGLSPNPDRSAPKLRDVIAVFSQSQLHCLGLSLFLARAEHEKLPFIVLDDPVLSSDEDYRVHFNTAVLAELLAVPMQVVILTQDHDTWEELETRYRHVGVSTAQLFAQAPAEGSIIENTSDALLAKITRARSLARGGHPDSRKECGIQLRDAGERFCKEILVSDRRARGEAAASLTDYDGKTLEWLCPRVDPLLDRDPSHPGKLQAFKDVVNNACHDNAPPGVAAMTHACGEIAFLQKQYLPR